jgi:hypothetical protein
MHAGRRPFSGSYVKKLANDSDVAAALDPSYSLGESIGIFEGAEEGWVKAAGPGTKARAAALRQDLPIAPPRLVVLWRDFVTMTTSHAHWDYSIEGHAIMMAGTCVRVCTCVCV